MSGQVSDLIDCLLEIVAHDRVVVVSQAYYMSKTLTLNDPKCCSLTKY